MKMISPVLSTSHTATLMIQIPSPENRSISPLSSSSSSTEIRGIKLFRAISRKLSRKSQENFNSNEDLDSRSSSTDSCSSTSAGRSPRAKKVVSCNFRNMNSQRVSSSSTDTISDSHTIKHKHSTSVENFKRAFQNLTLTSRSHSCNNSKEVSRKHAKKSSSPKKILRAPVTYTYVKGLSGLPTQRIPRTQTNMCYNGNCGYGVQYMASLHR